MSDIIVIEGPDGTGKSTAAKLLEGRLRDRGINTLILRDPGGTPFGEALREQVLSPEVDICPTTQFFAFLTSRCELTRAAQDYVRQGYVVILDRFWPSTYAYQGFGHGVDLKLINYITDFQLEQLVPSETDFMYFFLDATTDVRLKRLEGTGKVPDRFEGQDTEFYERVCLGYRAAFDRALFMTNSAGDSLSKACRIDVTDLAPTDVVEAMMSEFLKVHFASPEDADN